MKNITSILLIICLLFLAVKCPKPDNTPLPAVLPPATQTGANTFGCLLNGKVWLPSGNSGLPSLIVEYYKGDFSIAVKHNGNPDGNQGISWAYKPIYKTGTYYLNGIGNSGYPDALYTNYLTTCGYNSDNKDSLSNYVIITKLDSVNRIISGTFNLYFLPASKGCDTIKITNGRFDAKYLD